MSQGEWESMDTCILEVFCTPVTLISPIPLFPLILTLSLMAGCVGYHKAGKIAAFLFSFIMCMVLSMAALVAVIVDTILWRAF